MAHVHAGWIRGKAAPRPLQMTGSVSQSNGTARPTPTFPEHLNKLLQPPQLHAEAKDLRTLSWRDRGVRDIRLCPVSSPFHKHPNSFRCTVCVQDSTPCDSCAR